MSLIQLPELPYEIDELEPHISKETLEFHYGKHHQGYVNKLNKLIEGTKFAKKSLEEIVMLAKDPGIYNNAAQIFNHTFYWNCMSPQMQEPSEKILIFLKKYFGSVEEFKKEFTQAALTLFGSGWVWLVQKDDGTLEIKQTNNADCPLKNGENPILTCDVWEHAYYIDYRNGRKNYVEAWWNLVNWEFIATNLD